MASMAAGEAPADIYVESFERGTSLGELGFSGVKLWDLDATEGCMRFSAQGGPNHFAMAHSPRFNVTFREQGVEVSWKARFDRDDRHRGGGQRSALWVSLRDEVGEDGYTLLAMPLHGHGHHRGLRLDLSEVRGGKPRHLGQFRFTGEGEGRWLTFTLVLSPSRPGRGEGRVRVLLDGDEVIRARSVVPERFSRLTFRGRLDAAERRADRDGCAGERAMRIDDLLVRGTDGGASAPTVSLVASPPEIIMGDSATLTWSSTHADRVEIEPGLGSRAPAGSAQVSPAASTHYTATAIGLGGSASASAFLAVKVPPPTVRLTAAPDDVRAGEAVTLSWSSEHAQSLAIDNGIGTVAVPSGSLMLHPVAGATYTILAVGPGGSATFSTAVTVTPALPPPTVALRVEPEVIRLGESATLVWQSEHAAACSISPDVGSVALGGTLAVRPDRTTVYRIVASGPGGSAEASATLIVEEGMRLRIDTPLQGTLIADRSVRVEGVVDSGGREVGVTVNGLPALQDSERFVVNAVPLAPGANTLQAVATDGETGLQVATEVNLHCEPSAGFLRLTAQRLSGLAPFETLVTIEASFVPIQPEFGVEDPGGAEIIDGDDPLRRRVRIAAPGLVTLTAGGRDEAGVYHQARLTLQALDRAELDGILQNKFDRMKTALGTGDLEETLAEFTSPVREKYRTLFQGLQERLPVIAAQMRPIEMIGAGEDRARYRIHQLVTIKGQQYEIATYIHFMREDGLWRIESF